MFIRVKRRVGTQLADQPGGVERRAAGELGAFEHDDVPFAQFGEVVRNAGSAHTTADDDHSGSGARRSGTPGLCPET